MEAHQLKTGILVCLILVLVIQNFKYVRYGFTLEKTVSEDNQDRISPTVWLDMLKFLPMGERNCTTLGKNGGLLPLPISYNEAVTNHQAELGRILKKTGNVPFEGHSGQLQEEVAVYWKLASLPFVKTICETGFNAGHSTLVWLAANPDTKIYSFDIGDHQYARPMATYLRKQYPGRLTITWGDSTKTIPKFRADNPQVKCDLVIVDGGHTTAVATADFDNFSEMASDDNIVVFDDYPSGVKHFQQALGAMWERKKQTAQLVSIFECLYKKGSMRGFSVGRIAKC